MPPFGFNHAGLSTIGSTPMLTVQGAQLGRPQNCSFICSASRHIYNERAAIDAETRRVSPEVRRGSEVDSIHPSPLRRFHIALAGIAVCNQDTHCTFPIHAAQFRARGLGPDKFTRFRSTSLRESTLPA